jgi:hypothetical protein
MLRCTPSPGPKVRKSALDQNMQILRDFAMPWGRTCKGGVTLNVTCLPSYSVHNKLG